MLAAWRQGGDVGSCNVPYTKRGRGDMKILDLFCGGGGAAMGYHRAFPNAEIVGVDIRPQPRYPFTFIQDDALEYIAVHGAEFDFIHASPPCQVYSAMQHIHDNANEHPDLVSPTRAALQATSRPWVIENVKGAPLNATVMLCGTMFGLSIVRHRYFEIPWLPLVLLPPCDHRGVYDPWHGEGRTADKFREAMGIDWLPIAGGRNKKGSVDLAIPPAYTEWIGQQFLAAQGSRSV